MSDDEPAREGSVVFGRENLLRLGRHHLDQVEGGVGQLLLLVGEAGIGKSRLVRELAVEAVRRRLRVVRAAVFPGDLELSGGLLLDLAHELTRSVDPADQTIGSAVAALLTEVSRDAGDAHRRRRLLVLALADQVACLAQHRPTLLALEDLHWADDLALEVLGHLARRLPELPLLVLATVRSDELYPRVPMRDWRSRLLNQRLAREWRLNRLDPEQVAAMTTSLLGRSTPAPRAVVDLIWQRSNGIPLHVEELVSAANRTPDPAALGAAMPDTLRDAVLQRRAGLSEDAAAVAGIAAVIGRSFDLSSLVSLDARPVDRVADALEELVERAFVEPTSDGWYDFRHVLIREALESAVPLSRRRDLHARVARLSEQRPDLGGAAFRSAHEEAAGHRLAAHTLAVAAAQQAASISNHREALSLYRRAVRCAPPDLAVRERAALLIARGQEAAATDDNAGAARDFADAHQLLLDSGEPLTAGEVLPRLVAARHLLGDGLAARTALLERGLSVVDSAEGPESTKSRLRARLHAALSEASMLDRRLDESISYGEQALATAGTDQVTELNTAATLGAVLAFAGRQAEGFSRLEGAVHGAREHHWEAEAARGYRMLGTSASVLVEYGRAEQWLREGISYAERTEQWNHRHYMAAHLGHVLWAVGRWEEATEVVEHALADGRGGVTTISTALYVRGFLALARGRREDAIRALEEARDIGRRMGELQRLSPPLWGLAEQAVLDRRWAEAAALCRQGRQASAEVHDAAYLYPFLITGTRALIGMADPVAAGAWVDEVSAALLDRSIPGTLPAVDHARGLVELTTGRAGPAYRSLRAALAGWCEHHRWWESQWAAVDLARCAYRCNRGPEAARLLHDVSGVAAARGSAPLVAAAEELLDRHRPSHPTPWAPLSAREFEVAQLIAAGRTNREIGAALHVSAKTVGTHVEHILLKLGAGRRAGIAAWVTDVRAEGAQVGAPRR